MKILQINCVYKYGSTGKITFDLHTGLLERGIDSIVCYGRGKALYESGVYKTCPEWYSKLNNAVSQVTGIMYGGCFFSTSHLISIIKREKPDIVHLQCINGYFVDIYRLLEWLKNHDQRTVLTLHAEFMYTGGCGYALDCVKWEDTPGCGACPHLKQQTKTLFFDRTRSMWEKMNKAFQGFDNLVVVSVSPWLMKRAKQSSILSDKKHRTVYNGLDTSTFHSYSNGKAIKEKLGILDEAKVVFHATAQFADNPNHMKGGYFVLQLAQMRPEFQFVIAGTYSIAGAIPDNVILLGKVDNQESLAELYSMADVTIITSQRETYSMICAESLSCGTPVAGFLAGGPEAISIAEYSKFVQHGDVKSLAYAIDRIINNKWNHSLIEKKASDCYSIRQMVDSYLHIYEELI